MSDLSKLSDADLLAGIHADLDAGNSPAAMQATLQSQEPHNLAEKFGHGGGDVLLQGAKLATHAAAALPNFGIPSQGVPLSAQLDSYAKKREADWQANRSANNDTGFEGMRTVGQIAGMAPAMALMPAAAPESLMGAVGQGALSGAESGALMPTTGDGSFGSQVAKNVAIGAGTGGAMGGATYGAGALIGGAKAAKVGDDYGLAVQRLQSRGVTPTVGQLNGPTAAKVEDVAQPFSVFGQQRAIKQVNTAALKSVAAPLEAVDPQLAEVGDIYGRKGLSSVYDNLKAAFDKILPNVGIKVDGQFNQGLQTAAKEIDFASPATKAHYQDILQNQILPRIDANGQMSGEAFKALEEELSKQIGRLQPKGGDDAALADAFDGVLDAFRENLIRNNPNFGPQLKAVNTAYSRFADVRRAVANSKDPDGLFSPAGLWSALKAGDTSAGKYITAEGKGGDLQSLAADAVRVLGHAYPNSGTPARMLGMSLATGAPVAAAFAHPVGAGLLATTSAAYTPIGQRAISALASQRSGQVAPLMGRAIQSASPLLSAAAVPTLMGGN